MKKVLVIVAHPDDEVLGMGGTIAKLTHAGVEFHLLIVTDGSSSQYRTSNNVESIIAEKKLETKQACDILGIKSITYGCLPDMKLDCTPHVEINSLIEKTIDSIKPDTVFTHFYGDVNLDHRLVFNSVIVACRPLKKQCVKNIYCFDIPSSTEWNYASSETVFAPNVFIDIDEFLKTKIEALSCYQTELRDYPHPRSLRYVEECSKNDGIKVGLNAAERFVLIREIQE